MTPCQIDLVRTSFASVEPIADAAATIFYRRLFDLDPSLRRLFPNDLAAQRRNLMQTLTMVVRGLDRLERIVPGSNRSDGGTPGTGSAARTSKRSVRPSSRRWRRA